MSRTIKLTGIEIDFDEIEKFEIDTDKKEGFVTMENELLIFKFGGDTFRKFFADYHAIKYGTNEQNKNG